MTLAGIDYSFSRPDPARIHAEGYRFAIRYLDPGSKGVTRAEADALASSGLWIVSVYEGAATWMLGGWNAGQSAAHAALQLGNAAGMPSGRPVYFGCDFDAQPSQIGPVLNCLEGAASVLGERGTGVYGGLATVTAALSKGACKWAFQTLAWSGGQWHPGAHIRQTSINAAVGGQAVDLDEAMTADFGQWQPGKGPEPKVTITSLTADGKLSLAQIAAQRGAGVSTILRLTAEHGKFDAPTAAYINGVFSGKLAPAEPVPAGAMLWAPVS